MAKYTDPVGDALEAGQAAFEAGLEAGETEEQASAEADAAFEETLESELGDSDD